MAESATASSHVNSLPFTGFNGKGVRVAIIDSGVNEKHPHISRLAGGVCVDSDGSVSVGDYTDVLGHGTAVTAAIQEKAWEAEYFAIRLFHQSLRTAADGLFNAIEWAIEQRMDVINLSLGTRNAAHVDRLSNIVERANASGTIVVAAHDAHGETCYPGSLLGVISVGLDWDVPRETYRAEANENGSTLFYASGYPRDLPGMSRQRNLNGISFAVANMTGFVIRARQKVGSRSMTEVCDALLSEVSS